MSCRILWRHCFKTNKGHDTQRAVALTFRQIFLSFLRPLHHRAEAGEEDIVLRLVLD
jgi:hypothetical protein